MHHSAIHSVQMVLRENLFGFQGNQKSPYLKITVTDPKHISKLRSLLEGRNSSTSYKGLWKGLDGGIRTFDSIQYVLRFMIDTSVSWINLFWQLLLTPLDLRYVVGGSSAVEVQIDP